MLPSYMYVGHDDNVFLNGLAQQAIQKEIARLKVLPENLCSYHEVKGAEMQQLLTKKFYKRIHKSTLKRFRSVYY